MVNKFTLVVSGKTGLVGRVDGVSRRRRRFVCLGFGKLGAAIARALRRPGVGELPRLRLAKFGRLGDVPPVLREAAPLHAHFRVATDE